MSNSKPFDKEFIKELAELLSKCDLTEIELEQGESRLRVSREVRQNIYAPAYGMPAANMPMTAPPPIAVAPESAPAAVVISGEKITSPMVGTVYLSSEPTAPSFVKVGDQVQKGDTLLIVEAMKVMNNIPAPKSGVIKQVCVTDKDAVEYGQTLMIIE